MQKVLLREIALHWLQASLGPPDSEAASLQGTIDACNDSLARAAEYITEAAAHPAAAWGWPPAETCQDSPSIPADWAQPEHQGSLQQALQRLRLPMLESGQGAPYCLCLLSCHTAEGPLLSLILSQHTWCPSRMIT